ncbi:MAG: hypothetical protein JSR73_01670 [Proteobacteria bacterium]|nr:hypothetical protein [Pseudomonadota bacterium]
MVGRKLRLLPRAFLLLCLNSFVIQHCLAAEKAAHLPKWLLSAMEVDRKSAHPGSFEEASYEGKRVFQFTRGDRADTGDEHVLFSEDGKEICVFGGFAAHVTSGSCTIAMIVFVRKL